MKFPKSMHAEGWDRHFDGGAAAVKTNNPALNAKRGFKSGAKPVSLHTPLHLDAGTAAPTVSARPAAAAPTVRPQVAAPAPASVHATAPAVRPAATGAGSPAPRSSSVPWVVGAGVGVLLIGGAVVMSRNMSPTSVPSTPVVVGQVTPSPQDAQMQNSPPSAGPATAETVPEAAAETSPVPAVPVAEVAATSKPAAPTRAAAAEPPVVKPAPSETRVAQAPAPSQPQVGVAKPADKAVAAAPAAAPVIRTLTPQPEVLAQVTPPAVMPTPAMTPAPTVVPAASAVTAPLTAPPATPPVATAPGVPPVVAQQAPAPTPAATPDPMDASITLQVRQALAADAALATVPIAVTTDHGVVKLEGQAPDAEVRQRATVVAANTTGVKAVDNRLTLPPVAAVGQGAPSNGG